MKDNFKDIKTTFKNDTDFWNSLDKNSKKEFIKYLNKTNSIHKKITNTLNIV